MTPSSPRNQLRSKTDESEAVPVVRLKHAVRLVVDKVDSVSPGTRYVGLENIESWSGRWLNSDQPVDIEGGATRFHAGDVLFGKLRPYLAKSLRTDGSGVCTSELLVLRPHKLEQRYLHWLTLSPHFIEAVNATTFGAKMPRASWDNIGVLPVPVPPREDQHRIADFLYRKTAEIDALIAKKERMIALLNEKRQAVITQSAIYGLDATSQRRDSEVESLGAIPSHWMVCRIATVATKITNGFVGPTRGILFDDGVRYLQSLHIKNNRIRFDVPYFVNADWSSEHSKSVLRAGDVLIVQTGDIGQVAVVTPEFAGCNCHALIIVACHPQKCRGEYLSWLLNSQYGFDWLKAMQTGALHPHLNCTNIRDIPICLPPLHEQDAIIAHIARATTKIEADTERLARSISVLAEYRRALISETVAGRVGKSEVAKDAMPSRAEDQSVRESQPPLGHHVG